MANSKISALPSATTPLAGTEVLPIVQGGITEQVSVANLTAGRAVSATELTLTTGNLIVSNGQGIDFSATPNTGTSELFNDYEEGTWTVQWFDAATAGNQSASTTTGYYTKVGRIVTINFAQGNISTVGMTAANTLFYTLPFTAVNMGEIIGNGMLRAATWPLSSAVQTVQINSYLAGGTPSRASFQASVSTVNSVAVTVGAMTSGTSDLYVQLTFAA
jgi:hypothetical protein